MALLLLLLDALVEGGTGTFFFLVCFFVFSVDGRVCSIAWSTSSAASSLALVFVDLVALVLVGGGAASTTGSGCCWVAAEVAAALPRRGLATGTVCCFCCCSGTSDATASVAATVPLDLCDLRDGSSCSGKARLPLLREEVGLTIVPDGSSAGTVCLRLGGMMNVNVGCDDVVGDD